MKEGRGLLSSEYRCNTTQGRSTQSTRIDRLRIRVPGLEEEFIDDPVRENLEGYFKGIGWEALGFSWLRKRAYEQIPDY